MQGNPHRTQAPAGDEAAPPDRPLSFRLAPMPRREAVRTWAILLSALVLLAVFSTVAWDWRPARWAVAILGSLGGMLLLVVWGHFRPTHFTIEPRRLRIVCPIHERRVAGGQIRDVCLVTAADVGRARCQLGIRRIFGHYGLYIGERLGNFRAYASRSDGLVLIRRHGMIPLLLTPADPEAFVRALRQMLASLKPPL